MTKLTATGDRKLVIRSRALEIRNQMSREVINGVRRHVRVARMAIAPCTLRQTAGRDGILGFVVIGALAVALSLSGCAGSPADCMMHPENFAPGTSCMAMEINGVVPLIAADIAGGIENWHPQAPPYKPPQILYHQGNGGMFYTPPPRKDEKYTYVP
jgi:hypothetical protein